MVKRSFWQQCVAVLFPERCACCGEVVACGQLWCEDCRSKLPLIRPPVCQHCGLPKELCTCDGQPRAFTACVGAFLYEGVARQGMLRLKSLHKEDAAEAFGYALAIAVRREFADVAFDAITYVPATAREQAARGFNQCERLADWLGQELSLPVEVLLEKTVETKPQKGLSAEERTQNVLGAFAVPDGAPVKGRTILLVDDILTTGSTLNECSKMLVLAGAEAVYAAAPTITSLERFSDVRKDWEDENHVGNESGD